MCRTERLTVLALTTDRRYRIVTIKTQLFVNQSMIYLLWQHTYYILAFSVSAPSTWNSLPAHIRSIDTLSTFKRHLKFHLFQSDFTVYSSCASASDSFSRFLAIYKFVSMYVRITAGLVNSLFASNATAASDRCLSESLTSPLIIAHLLLTH